MKICNCIFWRTKERGWNTYQASSAVATVLTDLLAGSGGMSGTSVSVSGKGSSTNYGISLSCPADSRRQSAYFKNREKEPLLYSVYSMKRVMNARQSDAFKVEATLEK